ncbi:MAG: AIPR family protein [Nitrospirales bacterium]|nr:AIPR family protein [Nitrospirales bacterium]
MNSQSVRAAVQSFRERTAHGSHLEHCFAPWYLHQQYHLSETRAIQQSSDGNYDFGIDAFHLHGGDRPDSPTNLLLLQAKFTDSLVPITKGYKELERTLNQLPQVLDGAECELPLQNNVLVNLRAALNRLAPKVRASLHIDFVLLHISDQDSDIISHRSREARQSLREAISQRLADRICTTREVGPADLGPRVEVVVPPDHNDLVVTSHGEFPAGDFTKMHTANGRLTDLVELYRTRRDHLFSKNVRHFLHSKRNVEKGPAGKMRETLKSMCVEKSIVPERFALFHNGVTIYAQRVEVMDGALRIKEPFVLNGCQTIKNAFYFRNDPKLKDRIDKQIWERVAVPIRVIEATDGVLIRSVTINNNRQNAMAVSAFRANDPIQLDLEERFRKAAIFYERQEGAFQNLEMASPEILEDDYENSRGQCVNMVDLARCLAAAAGEIGFANHPADLFESDAAYERCFSRKRLNSIPFLVFLQNLDDVLGVILKKDLNLNPKGAGPRPARLKYYTLCLCVRYMGKVGLQECVRDFGGALQGKKHVFRDEIVRKLRSRSSRIRDELSKRFMSLDSNDAATMNDAWEHCQNTLLLRKNIDVFDAFSAVEVAESSQ